MKITIKLFCAIFAAGIYSTANAACPSEPGCTTNWLNVPGDFANPINNFSMYLLGGEFHVEGSDGNGGWSVVGNATPLNTSGKQIDFTATQFDHIGLGQGTSTLNASFNHYEIGSGVFFGNLTTLYIDGSANGSLVDNADSTKGDWTLNVHLFGDYGPTLGNDLGYVSLSTNAFYDYDTSDTATGTIMDYHTGLAYLVGQGVIQSGPFQGVRITVGLQGQDPLSAPVPVPAAAWLLGSGLIGLAGVAGKKKVS